jgi:hypothetical protein
VSCHPVCSDASAAMSAGASLVKLPYLVNRDQKCLLFRVRVFLYGLRNWSINTSWYEHHAISGHTTVNSIYMTAVRTCELEGTLAPVIVYYQRILKFVP